MDCPKCGTNNVEENRCCRHCGSRMQPNKPIFTAEVIGVLAIVGLIVCVLIIGAGISAYSKLSPIPAQANWNPPAPAPQPTPYWESASFKVTEDAFVVNAGGYHWFKFNVEEHWRNVKLEGKYRASGGSGNDIVVFLTNEDGLENFTNGHGFDTWYSSGGKVTVGSINKQLGKGLYYLIFSNKMAWISNKAVTADIQLHYEYLKDP
jgi:hypothetical protein